jgi:hypothetical protein
MEVKQINIMLKNTLDTISPYFSLKISKLSIYHPSQAQPVPSWQVLVLEIQESPQALPFLQTLQQL